MRSVIPLLLASTLWCVARPAQGQAPVVRQDRASSLSPGELSLALEAPVSESTIDPEVVRLQGLRRRPEDPHLRMRARWLVTVGAALVASGTVVAATFGRRSDCYENHSVTSVAVSSALVAAVGLSFTIGGGLRLAHLQSSRQSSLNARRLGHVFASLLIGATVSGLLMLANIRPIMHCINS